MEKKEVEKIYEIKREIKLWKNELSKLKAKSIAKGQQITGTGFQVTNATSDPTAKAAIEITFVEQKIAEMIAERENQEAEIMKFIESIEDSQVRLIIYYRCVCCQSWRNVAINMKGLTEDAARQMYHRFFKNQNGE